MLITIIIFDRANTGNLFSKFLVCIINLQVACIVINMLYLQCAMQCNECHTFLS